MLRRGFLPHDGKLQIPLLFTWVPHCHSCTRWSPAEPHTHTHTHTHTRTPSCFHIFSGPLYLLTYFVSATPQPSLPSLHNLHPSLSPFLHLSLFIPPLSSVSLARPSLSNPAVHFTSSQSPTHSHASLLSLSLSLSL